MSEIEKVAPGGLGAARIVDVDGGVFGRLLRVDEHGRDADSIQRRQGGVVRAEAQADETIDRRLTDRAFQRSVEGRNQEQRQVVLLDQLAEALEQLAQELVGENSAEALRDEDADGPAAAKGKCARGRMWRVAEVVGDLQHPLQGGLPELLGVVEREGDGGLRHASGAGHVSDSYSTHCPAAKGTKALCPSSCPHTVNRFSKAVYWEPIPILWRCQVGSLAATLLLPWHRHPNFLPASSSAPPSRPTRSRVATPTPTGGGGSTKRARPASSPRATRAITTTATARTSRCRGTWATTRSASGSSGHASSRSRASSRARRSITTAGCSPPAANSGSRRSSPFTTSRCRCGSTTRVASRRLDFRTCSSGTAIAPRRRWAT